MVNNNKVLETVKKLLALANNNNNENESQNAMLKAQEILAKNGLSISDVSEVGEKEKKVVHDNVTDYGKTLWWVKSVSVVIARNFRCEPYINSYRGGKTKIVFMGLKEDVEIAKEVFNFAVQNIKLHTLVFMRNYVNMGKYSDSEIKNTYIKGYIKGLGDKFKEQVDKNNWGLILVKDALVVKEVEKMNFRKSQSSSARASNDSKVYDSGYQQGKSFEYGNSGKKEIRG